MQKTITTTLGLALFVAACSSERQPILPEPTQLPTPSTTAEPSMLPSTPVSPSLLPEPSLLPTQPGLEPIVPSTPFLPELAFNQNQWPSDTTGELQGTVLFAQNQIIPAQSHIAGDVQPHLSGLRQTLVMYQDRSGLVDEQYQLWLEAYGADQQLLGRLPMAHPNDLPKQPKFIPGVRADDYQFSTELPAGTLVLRGNAQLALLNDPEAVEMRRLLALHDNLIIELADGAWTRDIYLPQGDYQGKRLLVRSTAGFNAHLHYVTADGQANTLTMSRNTLAPIQFDQGVWISPLDLEHSQYVYGHGFWSASLPAEWLQPGLSLQFSQAEHQGRLDNIRVGAPTELLLHTIDVGMLTPPRDQFHFAQDQAAQREYFQTIPVSRMVVSQYESLHLTEVMMPDGVRLTALDPTQGGWHDGGMRQQIGKVLISIGINNANYGIWSSPGMSEQGNPYLAAQLTAHNSVGMYANGRVVHGGSGGAGMVTLDSSIGNEFSHEVGHNYNLGHYVGGANGSIHRPANELNSTWGWDSERNIFVPNFENRKTQLTRSWDPSWGQDQNNGTLVRPFNGYRFGMDSMAGGAPMWPQVNRFTLYTPYVMRDIQRNLESKIVFDALSATGFSKWNAEQQQMQPYEHLVSQLSQVTAVPSRTSSQIEGQWVADQGYLQSLYDQGADWVVVAMANGSWSGRVAAPAASSNEGRLLEVKHSAGWSTIWQINGQQLTMTTGTNRLYRSNGISWLEVSPEEVQRSELKRPIAFGVPVTTLVGYYDPELSLTSYVYPALHGSYGFVYRDDSGSLNNQQCQLVVSTNQGERRFRLSPVRMQAGSMNKYHVNLPASEQASRAEVRCAGQVLASRQLEGPRTQLQTNVLGLPLP